jgi:hypothetical protein
MKAKRLFQIFVLLALLFSPLGSSQSVRAGTDSVDDLDAIIIDRNLDYWDNNYLGYASSSIYENWWLGLAESHNFIVTVSPFLGDLVPLLILLDADGNELARGIGTITSAQPAGDYSILVQPQTGAGFYFLLLREITQTQPLTTVLLDPSSLNAGETAVASVNLNNVPVEGYTSAEFTCFYDSSVVEVSNIVVPNRFGPDPVVAINGPQNNKFIVAIAGSHGNKATTSGTAFSFHLKGLQAGQSAIECTARVSKGDKVLVELPSVGSRLTVLGNAQTATALPAMRITFDPGQTTASRIGIINPNETIRYLLNAAAGQVLSIKLIAPANEVAIGVNGPTGLALKPLDASYTWNTTITTGGDHTITLIALNGGSSKSYTLEVNLTTPAPTTTSTINPSPCDKAEFIADVNVPPGTVIAPGAQFMKTWRLKNVGTCTWTTSYQLVFFSGEKMGAPSFANFPRNVEPGQTVDLSINMIAPSTPGQYRGYWMFKNVNGALFGVGPVANEPWFVDIVVSGGTATPTPTGTLNEPNNSPTPSITPGGPTATPIPGVVYDFATNACAAAWFSGAGRLVCPGIDGDPKGFMLILSNPKLETGTTDTRPGLLTFPQNIQNGYIQGAYPPIRIQNGDRFRATIGCEGGATNCYAAFRLDYQIGNEPIRTFWGPFLERYDGRYYSIDVDLSSLAGKDVKFILTVLSAGVATGDRALWVGPIIYRADATPTSTSEVSQTSTAGVSPTFTPTSTMEGSWFSFGTGLYHFQFLYPGDAQLVDGSRDNYARINLPFASGTNLSQKYMEMIVTENADPCRSPLATSSILETSETVVINSLTFLKETGQDGSAGHLNKWVAYSTSRDDACVSLNFVLRSANPDVFATPPPLYDEAAESVVFRRIVSTFAWLPLTDGTGTPAPAVGLLTGKVFASKLVRIEAYNADNHVVGAGWTNPDGSFEFYAASGTNSVVAMASGFLIAQRLVTITDGSTTTLPTITLLAGDIDSNNVIDQFDALTIGISYNTSAPSEADLNDDGIINVLDLELLAQNYRKVGPVDWN